MRAFSVVLLLAAAVAAAASPSDAQAATPTDDFCAGGTAVDGGSFGSAERLPAASGGQRFVQLLTPASYPAFLNRICACLEGTKAVTAGLMFEVYDTSGAGGKPGRLLGAVPGTVRIPAAFGRATTSASCVPLDLSLPSGSVYVGVEWEDATTPYQLLICLDESPATPPATMYQSGDGGHQWVPVTNNIPGARALGLRAVFGSPAPCIPDDRTLCLNSGRFKVTAAFDAGAGTAGNAHVVKLTDDTGYLWFFSSSNVEAVVKVLNACGLGSHYWVFAGGLTNVQVALTVTDSLTGAQRTYMNPANTTFQPIQDTSAFSTCP